MGSSRMVSELPVQQHPPQGALEGSVAAEEGFEVQVLDMFYKFSSEMMLFPHRS